MAEELTVCGLEQDIHEQSIREQWEAAEKIICESIELILDDMSKFIDLSAEDRNPMSKRVCREAWASNIEYSFGKITELIKEDIYSNEKVVNGIKKRHAINVIRDARVAMKEMLITAEDMRATENIDGMKYFTEDGGLGKHRIKEVLKKMEELKLGIT